jgi:hypothetical protein
MDEPRFEPLFEMEVELERPQLLGHTPQGNRQIFYVRSGTFEGPKVKGNLLSGGGDWFVVRPDGVGEMDVRATLQTDDGDLIFAYYRGLFSAPTDVWSSIVKGEQVPRDKYYFYTQPLFQTSAPKYDWLNRTMSVGIGFMVPGGVSYKIFSLV